MAGGSACTAAQAIHELLPKADTGKLMRWVRRSAHFAVLCLVLVSNASPLGGLCFLRQSAVSIAPSAAVKVSRAPAPKVLGA